MRYVFSLFVTQKDEDGNSCFLMYRFPLNKVAYVTGVIMMVEVLQHVHKWFKEIRQGKLSSRHQPKQVITW